MTESEDLILDKAKESDLKSIWRNVWSRAETAKYMFWQVTPNEEQAKARIQRTIAYQKANRDVYFVYEKRSGEAIGFTGFMQKEPGVCEECGICVGPEYTRRGYGKQILRMLASLAANRGAHTFIYSAMIENLASQKLALSCGFCETERKEIKHPITGAPCRLIVYSAHLPLNAAQTS